MKKYCENAGCSLVRMEIDPGDRTDCISCGRPLVSRVGKLFGEDSAGLSDLVDMMEGKKRDRQEDFLDTLNEALRKKR